MKKSVEKKLVSVFAAVLMVGAMAGVSSATQSSVDTFKKDGICTGCDFTGDTVPQPAVVNTNGLKNAIMKNAILSPPLSLAGYDLNGAKFNNATASISFKKANINGAVFDYANLGTSDFSETTTTGTAATTFVNADLRTITKPTTWPTGCKFNGAKWAKVDGKDIVCDTSGSLGKCKVTACGAVSTVKGANTGYVDNAGTCTKNP